MIFIVKFIRSFTYLLVMTGGAADGANNSYFIIQIEIRVDSEERKDIRI